MGANQWRTSDTGRRRMWTVTYYLDSDGSANSVLGNGRLTTTKPEGPFDVFVYDPMQVPSLSGQICCFAVNR